MLELAYSGNSSSSSLTPEQGKKVLRKHSMSFLRISSRGRIVLIMSLVSKAKTGAFQWFKYFVADILFLNLCVRLYQKKQRLYFGKTVTVQFRQLQESSLEFLKQFPPGFVHILIAGQITQSTTHMVQFHFIDLPSSTTSFHESCQRLHPNNVPLPAIIGEIRCSQL